MKQEDLLNKLYKECGLALTDVFESKHFKIITRSGIEKIQYAKKIEVGFVPVSVNENYACLKAIGILETPSEEEGKPAEKLRIETFGSACNATVKGGNAYYAEMAEKRALSRVVLKLMGLYEHGFLGEDEDLIPDEPATTGQLSMIENLLRTSILDEQDVIAIEDEMPDYTDTEASECINMLNENQREPANPQLKDIQKELDKKFNDPKS